MAKQPIPDSLTTCAVPTLTPPEKASQDDIAVALIAIYAAWEDCFDTVKRLAAIQQP